jgi:hypothetical protein
LKQLQGSARRENEAAALGTYKAGGLLVACFPVGAISRLGFRLGAQLQFQHQRMTLAAATEKRLTSEVLTEKTDRHPHFHLPGSGMWEKPNPGRATSLTSRPPLVIFVSISF